MTMENLKIIDGLSHIADRYDAFIFDIFGVIHDGLALFPGTVQCLEELKNANKFVCMLSNSPRRARGAADQMDYMGLPRALYDHIVTSGEASWRDLQSRPKGQACWYIGTGHGGELRRDSDHLNFVDGPEGADFIVNSIPGTEPSAVIRLMTQLEIAAERRLPMICANPDLVVNIGSEQFECAGTFAALYEEMGGEVIYHGKPHGPVYETCHELLGRPDKSRILAVGDSLHTDIAGANMFGIDSVFNLVGIHWEEVQMDHRPGKVDQDKILKMLETKPQKPDYAMAGFQW